MEIKSGQFFTANLIKGAVEQVKGAAYSLKHVFDESCYYCTIERSGEIGIHVRDVREVAKILATPVIKVGRECDTYPYELKIMLDGVSIFSIHTAKEIEG